MGNPLKTSCDKCGAAWTPEYEHSVGSCRDNLAWQNSTLREALNAVTGYASLDRIEFWRLSLNKYQRDNLLGLLRTIVQVPQLNILNSGDWVGEIYQMIERGPEAQPNSPPDTVLAAFARMPEPRP